MEVLQHGLAVDGDAACARPHVHDRFARLALAIAPGATLRVELGLSEFLGQGAPEIEQVDPVELGEVIGAVQLVGVRAEGRVVHLIGKAAQVVAQVVPVVGILLERVEEGDLLVLFGRQSPDRVVSQRVLEADLPEDLLRAEDVARGDIVDLRLVIEPVGLFGVERGDNAGLPVELILPSVLLRCGRLLQDVLAHVKVTLERCGRLRRPNELV